jgi:UMF1 family MFS transporter
MLVGLTKLRRTLAAARHYPQALLFLGAFLLYSDGIQTVFATATVFGQEELGLSVATLTLVVLGVQFAAAAGTLVFKYVADGLVVLTSRYGPLRYSGMAHLSGPEN